MGDGSGGDDDDDDSDSERKKRKPKGPVDPNQIYKGQFEVRSVEDGVPPEWYGLDLGEATVEQYKTVLQRSKTVLFAGVMGAVECDAFQTSTREILGTLRQHASGKKVKSVLLGA